MKNINFKQYLIENQLSLDELGIYWVHFYPDNELISFSNGLYDESNPTEEKDAKFVFKPDEFEVITDAFSDGKETCYKGSFMYDEFGRRTGISLNNSIFLFVMND